ncbi:hypothetical protein ACHAWF_011573 [Thalassiosira exigua]
MATTTANATAAAAAAASAPFPSLPLSQVQWRYPRLFAQYSHLSDRDAGCDDLMDDLPGRDDGPPPVDAATGLRTTIMMVDFARPLEVNEGCPMETDSDANRFAIFLWRMLQACESGSVGGDACRQYDALRAAVDDVLAICEDKARFEHLLGWTVAAANHQLDALLCRGDPFRNRLLFKAISDAWRKIFEANLDGVISKDLLSFANWQCQYFQKLLKEAKKEYGDHARYIFNFKKKPRPASSGTIGAVGAATAAAAASAAPSAAAAASSAASSTTAGTKRNENSIPVQATAYPGPRLWEEEGWVPMTSTGKQKTPNVIRGELQRYIDQCKADGTSTQTAIIQKMGVNNNTFRRFMNPKTYKNQFSAMQNGTYWAGARLLAEVKAESDWAKKTGAKRKAVSGGDSVQAKKAKAEESSSSSFPSKSAKAQIEDLITKIKAVEGVSEDVVYDTCPQLVAKIKDFIKRDGATKAALLKAFGDINNNSMGRFLSGKGQDQCGNVTYKAAWTFFEKLRILEGAKKSKARCKNEAENPNGFSLRKSRAGYFKYLPGF